MKILINGSTLVVGGGLQVGRSLLVELARNPCGHTIKSVASKEFASVLPLGVDTTVVSPSLAKPLSGRRSRKQLQNIEKEFAPDIILTIFGPAYWKPESLHVCGFANSWTFTANNWARKTLGWNKRPRSYLMTFLRRIMWKYEDADALIVETEALRESLQKIWPEKTIAVVYNNCGQSFYDFQSAPNYHCMPPKAPDEFRIVTLSQYYPHKNLEIIPAIAAKIKNKIPSVKFRFYLSLEADSLGWQKILRLLKQKGVEEYIQTVGTVPPSIAPSFYHGADIMLLPSVLESFSANYPEAMISGVPILTTDMPFARNICEDAAVYFRPMDPSDAADKIIELYENNNLYLTLVKNGYERVKCFPSPREKAEQYLKFCEEIFQNHRS